MRTFSYMTKLELLAPAKDLEHGKAAINHGADAVYMGAPMFSARKAAGSTLSEIEALTKHAHLYNARVFVALNTILFDHELEEAERLIHQIYNTGADALIIQDMGILEMSLPPIALHASTQTHNTTPEKVLFLEKTGFQRVILARELSLEQIKNIKNKTTVELESFVHGALCVSFSGQGYMSQSVCSRSGNRGECAQPCRSSYHLTDENGNILIRNKHLLSIKDLNLSNEIPEMIRAGITSFKIEGRLKDMGYVKNIVSHYRRELDRFMAGNLTYRKASSGNISFSFIPDPLKTFNRGYTNYNLKGREQKLSTFNTQKSLGKKVGEVTAIKGSKIFYQGDSLKNGDGICFFSKENELKGFQVNIVEGNTIVPSNTDSVYAGAVLYRNFDIQFENELKKSDGNRKIPVDIFVSGNLQEITIRLKDTDQTEIKAQKQLNGEKANDPIQCDNMLKSQLGKFGSTPFSLNSIDIALDSMPFLRVSEINELRRVAVESLIKERLRLYKRKEFTTTPNDEPYPQLKPDFRANISNQLAERFYRRHGCEIAEKAFELKSNVGEAVLMETKHCIRYQIDACLLTPNGKNVKDPIYLKDQNTSYLLRFKCKECVMQVVRV